MRATAASVPGFTPRERRVLLWLCSAAMIWRWLIAMRTPLPTGGGCELLWLAEHVANGEFAVLARHWWDPTPTLLLALPLAAGAPVLLAAKVFEVLVGAMTLVPVALAAQRLRAGAGVPAAVLMVGASLPTLAGAAADPGVLHGAALAAALAAGLAGRRRLACLGATIGLAGAVGPRLATDGWWWRLVPIWPLLAALVGAWLVRLPRWPRELLLCVAVAGEFHLAWHAVAPPAAASERALGAWLRHRVLAPDDRIVTDRPCVLWAAGCWPDPVLGADACLRSIDAATAIVVLGPELARDASLRAGLAARFGALALPNDLQELVTTHGLTVLVHR